MASQLPLSETGHGNGRMSTRLEPGGAAPAQQTEEKAQPTGGSEVRGTVDPDGRGTAYGRIDSIKDPYPPGSSHVPHQDDWLNPDTSKLPPTPLPRMDHVITNDEARGYPVVAGVGLGLAGAIPGAVAAATAGSASFGAYMAGAGSSAAGGLIAGLDRVKDWSEAKFAGGTISYPDPEASHMDNQTKGYTD